MKAIELADAHDECAKVWLESSDAHKFRKETAAILRTQAQEIESLIKERDAYKADADRFNRLLSRTPGVLPMIRVQVMTRGQYIRRSGDELVTAIDAMKGQS